MMNCEHFTIRGAVAEFRKKDWRLNNPFRADCELRPEAVLLPLKIPKSRWWCCDSCVVDLLEETSGAASIVSEDDTGLKSDNCYFDKSVNSAGTSAVLSDVEVVPKEDSSTLEKDNCNARAVTDTSASAFKTDKLLNVDNAGVVINAIDNSVQMESKDAPTVVIGGQTTGTVLPMVERRTAELFDLNQIPHVESSELALVTDGIQCDEQKASVDLHAGTAETPDPIVRATDFASEDNFNHPPSPEKETGESSRGEGEVVTGGNVSVKKRTPKYRLLSELLTVKEEDSENVPSGGTIDIDAPFLKNNCKLKRKRKLRIQEKQDPGHSNLSEDEHEAKIPNRTTDHSLLKENDRMLSEDNVQPSLIIFDKRMEHDEVRDEASKIDLACLSPSERYRNNAPPNEAGNMLLPQKQRMFCNDVLRTNDHTGKSSQVSSDTIWKQLDGCDVSRKKVSRGQSCANKKQSASQFVDNGEFPIERIKAFNDKDINQEQYGAHHQKKDASDLMELDLKNRSPSSSQIPWLQSKNALSGMDILSIVAAETTDSGTVVATEKNNAILPYHHTRQDILILAPSDTLTSWNTDVLGLGNSGCVEAMVPTGSALTEQDGKLYKLGPEDFRLRSAGIIQSAAREHNGWYC